MKNLRITVCLRALAALMSCMMIISVFSGCVDSVQADKIDSSNTNKYEKNITLNHGDNVISETGNYKMSIDKESLCVSVINKNTGTVWRTNPEDADSDTVAQGNSKDMLKSQFQLNYYDTNGNLKTMNSYTDSLKLNQTKVFSIENGIAVKYFVGDTTRGESDVPEKISNKRFTENVLSKLNESDAAELKAYYKHYNDEDMWSIRAVGRNNISRVLELFDAAEYTVDDLEKDNGQFGIASILSKKASFEIVIEYIMDGDTLKVNVPVKYLKYSDDFPLYQIKLLENFISARGDLDGYILLPDGCGSIINFDQNVVKRDMVSIPVYGADGSLQSSNAVNTMETACLPVFGMKNGETAALAVIESGESTASIEAYRAGRNNDNYAVYPVFNVVNMEFIRISGSDSVSTVPAFQSELFDGNYSVSYMFINGDKANYSGMAEIYRNKLIDSDNLTPLDSVSDIPMVIGTVNGVTGYKSFLGISHIGLTAATTYKQNIEILNALNEAGISKINLKISGWFNNGYRHDYPKSIELDKALGGKRGFKSLLSYCNNNDIDVYPDVDLINAYSSGKGFNPVFDAARYLDETEVKVSQLSFATKKEKADDGLKNTFSYIISPKILSGLIDEFISKSTKYDFNGLYLRNIGNQLYSDYNKRSTYSRPTTQKIISEQLSKISNQYKNTMVSNGNLYTLPYVKNISDVSLQSSAFTVTDYAVPFYQMVLHGYKNMFGVSMNYSDDIHDDVLKSIEYGVGLQYQLIYQDSSFLKNTEYNLLYRSNYSDLMPEIEDNYKMVNSALKKVWNEQMTGHYQIDDNVYVTEYSNGIKIYVNYGTEDVKVKGIIIKAKNFKIEED